MPLDLSGKQGLQVGGTGNGYAPGPGSSGDPNTGTQHNSNPFQGARMPGQRVWHPEALIGLGGMGQFGNVASRTSAAISATGKTGFISPAFSPRGAPTAAAFKAAAGTTKAANGLRVAGQAAGVVAAGVDAVLTTQEELKAGRHWAAAAGTGVCSGAATYGAAYGGALLGGKLGAAIGTFICPGVGTAIGAVAGAVVGGIAGGIAGGWAGKWIGRKVTNEGFWGNVGRLFYSPAPAPARAAR